MLMVTQSIIVSNGHGLGLGILVLLMMHKGTFSSEFCFDSEQERTDSPG